MAFNTGSGSGSSSRNTQSASFTQYGSPPKQDSGAGNPTFDVFEWYPKHMSCYEYFINHSQHNEETKALATFLNIRLPCQKQPAVTTTRISSPRAPANLPYPPQRQPARDQSPPPPTVSLTPYVRRLVATGWDRASILYGLFGKDWEAGIGAQREIERRNYLFAAKSTPWLTVKQSYDIGPDETIPFLSTLKGASEEEIATADTQWSEWMAMGDWMLGPRAPDLNVSTRVKRERE